MKKIVIIESPYAGDIHRNLKYARQALKDSLDRGEAPFASHLLYTQVLNDRIPVQRKLGLDTGKAFTNYADLMAVYTDHGITPGMQQSIDYAALLGTPIEERQILMGHWVDDLAQRLRGEA